MGDLLGDGTHTYGYTGTSDQLTSVSGGGESASLAYDGLGRLWQTAGSATTRFAYDGSMITLEADGSGNILRRYLPGPDGTPLVWYEGSGTANRNFLLKDQQGSVIAIANSSGQLTSVNSYDPYGQPGTANTGRFQYAGYPWVPEAGLYNTGARSYSPTLGRFLQTDPIGYGDGMNWYAYAHGDPVNGIDPTGTELIGAAVGAILGVGEGLIAFAATPNANLGTFAVDVFGGGLVGGVLGFFDPSPGLIASAAILGGALDVGGQVATNGGFNNFNQAEAIGAVIGGGLAGGLGAGIIKLAGKTTTRLATAAVAATAGLHSAPASIGGGLIGGALGRSQGFLGGYQPPLPTEGPPTTPAPGTATWNQDANGWFWPSPTNPPNDQTPMPPGTNWPDVGVYPGGGSGGGGGGINLNPTPTDSD